MYYGSGLNNPRKFTHLSLSRTISKLYSSYNLCIWEGYFSNDPGKVLATRAITPKGLVNLELP